MLKYIDDLYLTDVTERDLNKIKRKLRLGAGMAGLYVIMLSEGPDMFEIMHASMFKIRRIRHKDHVVIGLAESRRKAYRLVERIICDHYTKTGGYSGIKASFEGGGS
ncbi:MAG: hypothetical protein K5857_02155 [Lachnospiraceae bacterium]|nr:hypothetical protein [Lachnospiraceae bacterium]